MNEIVKLVSDKFHLSPEVSQQIVDFVVGQVKSKLPENLSQHIDTLIAGGAEAEGIFEKVKDLASGLLHHKK
ncbi:MAG TPA: hypothetical protein VMU45_06985 [Candidatus Eisenbacteria bacterium]|nr:hypothetical protein [Candidatus Eisenbacteria bacterium]